MEDTELRILLVGKSGSGKSATGNTILNHTEFLDTFSFESVTMQSRRGCNYLEGRTIMVIDTPGNCHTSLTEEEVKNEIKRGIELSIPGVHVILLVIKLGVRYGEEESKAVEWFQKNLGKEAHNFTMVLFTYGDLLKKPIEDHLNDCPKLNMLVDEYKGVYHVFQNKQQDQVQVTELLKKFDELRQRNENKMYINQKSGMWLVAASTLVAVGAVLGGIIAAVARK